MKNIRVQFEVPQDKLPVVTALLAGEVSNFTCRDMADVIAARAARIAPVMPVAPAPRQAVPARRSIHQTVLAGLIENRHRVGDELPYDKVSDWLEADGYSRNSYSPAIGILVETGVLSRIGKKRIRILSLPVTP